MAGTDDGWVGSVVVDAGGDSAGADESSGYTVEDVRRIFERLNRLGLLPDHRSETG